MLLHSPSLSVSEKEPSPVMTDTGVLSYADDNESTVNTLDLSSTPSLNSTTDGSLGVTICKQFESPFVEPALDKCAKSAIMTD